MSDSPKRPASPRPTIVNNSSIVNKRFKRTVDVKYKVNLDTYEARTHPLVVAADLKRGSIENLAAYIERNQGIPDPEVATELLKMIAGSAEESLYRLTVIRHPDLKPNAKISPNKLDVRPPTQKDYAIAAWYDDLVPEFGKGQAVIAQMLSLMASQSHRKQAFGKLSRTGVMDALRRVRYEAETVREFAKRVEETNARRDAALANLRDDGVAKQAVPDELPDQLAGS